MTVIADFTQVDALAVDLAAAGAIVQIASDQIVDAEAEQIRRDASLRSPVLTGALAAGWYIVDDGNGAIITNDERQAFYQEFGTTRHGPQPSLFPAANRGEDRMAVKLELIAGDIL